MSGGEDIGEVEVIRQTGATYSSLMGAGIESPRRSKSVMIVSHHAGLN